MAQTTLGVGLLGRTATLLSTLFLSVYNKRKAQFHVECF